MSVNLRAPLAVATVAAVGAAALAIPPAAPLLRPAPVAAGVTLAALTNPVEQLLATAELAQSYLFGAFYNGPDSPTPGAGEANWPYAGMDQTGGDILNYALYNQKALGYYTYVGLVPNTATDASPVLRELEVNLADYINQTLTGVLTAASVLAAGVWDFPSAVISAAQLLLQGQFAQAASVLGDAITGPVTAAAQSLLSAGSYVLSNVVARLGAVAAALPGIAATFARATVGGVEVLAGKTSSIVTDFIGQVTGLDFPGAWNVAVAGLLGPSGLPGTMLNLTLGAGVQTGPIATPGDIPANFVPSERTAYQAAIWTIQTALTAQPASASAVPARPGRASAGPRAAAAREGDSPDRRAGVRKGRVNSPGG